MAFMLMSSTLFQSSDASRLIKCELQICVAHTVNN